MFFFFQGIDKVSFCWKQARKLYGIKKQTIKGNNSQKLKNLMIASQIFAL